MTDTINVEEPEDGAGEEAPGEAELRGRYVEGSSGKAGKQPGRHADEEEGQYTEGDYGEAGSRGGMLEPLGGKAAGSGRFPEADLGDAGTVPGGFRDALLTRRSASTPKETTEPTVRLVPSANQQTNQRPRQRTTTTDR